MRFQTLLTSCLLSVTLVSAASLNGRQAADIETKSLDELYQLALAEGGDLIVKAGGDEKNQQDGLVEAFKAQFPGINLNVTVDLSKVLLHFYMLFPLKADLYRYYIVP